MCGEPYWEAYVRKKIETLANRFFFKDKQKLGVRTYARIEYVGRKCVSFFFVTYVRTVRFEEQDEVEKSNHGEDDYSAKKHLYLNNCPCRRTSQGM